MEKEQIIKALECCGKASCKECPFALKGKSDIFDDINCIAEMAVEARSIICEQERRIEELALEKAGFEAGAKAAAKFVRAATVRKMAERFRRLVVVDLMAITKEQALFVIDQIEKEILEET